MPGISNTGINTATRDKVMESTVKPISREPIKAASKGFTPISMWRTIFSNTTIASSTTKPTERVKAIRVKLLRLKLSKCMTPNVPMIDMGKAILGIMVAEILPRNK